MLRLRRLRRPGALTHGVHILHHPDGPRGRVEVVYIAGVRLVRRGGGSINIYRDQGVAIQVGLPKTDR